MIKSGKKQKKSIFFQGGWEIAAFFYYISTKKLLPYGQQLFCAEGALFGICHNSRKVISLNPTYARARVRAVRARARGASACACACRPNSIGHLVKDDGSYAPHFPVPRPP